MALKNINEDLYRKESEAAKRGHNVTPYNEWQAIEKKQDRKTIWRRAKDSLANIRFTATLWGIMAVFAVLVLSLILYIAVQYQRSYFNPENVKFSMSTPRDIPSNRGFEIIFTYENNNRANLKDVQVEVEFDQYFIPEETAEFRAAGDNSGVLTIGNIPGKSKGSHVIVGQFVAPQNEVETIVGDLQYNVVRRSESYSTQESASVTITSSPLVIDILAPEEVANGNSVDIRILYRNTGPEAIDDVGMDVTFPINFVVQEARPIAAQQDNIWSLGTIESGGRGEIFIRGKLDGSEGDIRVLEAQMIRNTGGDRLGYTRDEHSFRFTPIPLTISQTITGKRDNIVGAGDELEYAITFTNTSSVPLQNIILRAFPEGGDLVKYEAIQAGGQGYYDAQRKFVEWKAVDVPELANLNPGDGGSVRYSVPIKSRIPVRNLNETNFVITSRVEADAPELDQIVGLNKGVLSHSLDSRVKSKLLINYGAQIIEGSLPPQVGQPTIVRIELGVGSVNNTIDDVVLSGNIASSARIASQGDASAGVTLNERTNRLIWNVGSIENAAGVLRPFQTTSFNVEILPQIGDVRETQEVLQNISIRGMDEFIGQEVVLDVDAFTVEDIKKASERL